MGSKSVFLLCLFLAISLLVISEVAARDLAETTTSKKTEGENGLNDAKYGRNGGYGGGGNGGYGGGGNGGYGGYGGGGNGGYGGGGNGGYGGGGNGGYGGGGNGGYGGGGGGYGRYCRYGCCRRGYYGRGCQVCCRYAGQAEVTVKPEAKPHN